MIISHGRKYIFVHIPKTGGTSLNLALEARAMKDDILIGDTPKAKNRRGRLKGLKSSGRLWKHARLTDIYGLVSQEQIDSYFIFTIVRNPWDRMVSYYHWLKQQSFDHHAVKTAKSNSFSEFLSDPVIRQSLQNDATQHYISDKNGIAQCDMYLRQDRLAEDVVRLEQSLGIKLAPLPHGNRSSRAKGYAEYYDDTSKAIISMAFAKDIQKFGYRF